LSNHAKGFEKQAALFAFNSCPLSGIADVLARESTTNEVGIPIATASSSFVLYGVPLPGRLATVAMLSPIAPDALGVGRKRGNVSPSSDVGPVSFQNSRCVVIDFYLPFANHPGTFKSKIKTTDSSKQAPECKRLLHTSTPL